METRARVECLFETTYIHVTRQTGKFMHFHRFKTKSLRAKTTGAREFVWPLTICLRHADEKSQLIYGTESRCPGGSSSQGCCHHMDTYIIALHTQANQQCVKCCQRSRNAYSKVDKGLVFTDLTHIVAHHRYCVSHTCAPRKLGASHTLLHFSLLSPTSYLMVSEYPVLSLLGGDLS
jgi:hypothetical protein